LAAGLEQGYAEEQSSCRGLGGQPSDFLRLLPNKDWVPFGSAELEPIQGMFGSLQPAVAFYLKPSLMPVGGFGGWKAHPIYQKDLAFVRKDSAHEIRLNKEIATRWTAAELLDFAEDRRTEFDVANAVTTLHRIAKATDRWNFKRDPRLRQVIAQTVDILSDESRGATARDVAKTQWSMGRLKHSDHMVQDRLSETVLRRIDDFEPQGLSNIIWSYAYTGPPSSAVLQAVGAKFWQSVTLCDPQALSNVAWSFAKLSVSCPPMLDDIATAAVKKAEGFDPQGLANLAWALATLQQPHPPLFECLAEVFAEDTARWQPQNIANLLWAYAKLLVTDSRLLDAVAAEAVATVDNWSYQGLANITWAYAKLGCNGHIQLFESVAAAVIQKISTFTPQNTVNVAWAYAKTMLATEALMDAVAQDVIAKARDFSPQHCSNTAWAFGTVSILNEEMMEAIQDATSRRLSEFNGQDLANMAWTCSKLVWAQPSMLEALASDMRRKVPLCTPQNVAITAWAFGYLAVANELLMESIAENVVLRIEDFGAQGLSNLAHGFAKQAICDVPAMEAIAAETARTIRDFTHQEFAATTWAFAKLGLQPRELIDVAFREMKRRMLELIPQDLAMLAWSSAHFEGDFSRRALEELSWEVMRQSTYLCPQDLANVSWAFATAGVENAMMMEAIAKETAKKVQAFSAQDLANTCWAFAKLGIAVNDMFDAIATEVVKKLSTLLPQNISIICWAFAKLGLLNDDMMEAVAAEISKRAQEFDGQGVGNIIWSFGVLCLREHKKATEAVVDRAMSTMSTLTAQEISNVAWGLSSMSHVELLSQFHSQAVKPFLAVASTADGASWTDFANITAQTRSKASDSTKLSKLYRASFFEPLLARLSALRDSSMDLEEAIRAAQHDLDATGAPYFGAAYTREALTRLGIGVPSSSDSWARGARHLCLEAIGEWQIPSSQSILAYAEWSLLMAGSAVRLSEPGRLFTSSWSQVSDEVKAMLHPFTQIIRRDMHAERVALLELLDAMIQAARQRDDSRSPSASLGLWSGHVCIYLSHFPSISSLGVFCQFMRWCPQVTLDFDFDDAWLSCCGQARIEPDG